MRPNLRRIDYWANHERRVHQVLTLALQRLSKKESLPTQEDPLNRQLYFCALHAIREMDRKGVPLASYPMYEANNQPDAGDEERTTREGKRPDFQFGYIDNQEPDPDKSAKQYVVECKRLGKSGRSNWVLNENYVRNGIVRFRNPDHGYAQACVSGAMIGYVQNTSLDQVLREVNDTTAQEAVPDLELSADGWRDNGVSWLEHTIERDIRPSPFRLSHLWLDLTGQSRRPAEDPSAVSPS